ncbi:hypothetical protein BGZ61DRAFT_372375 [Ilyonectria robusta]|uniref:uncharacterized protein n=1 Tax=Ilyonectria robusta TaxID=1079257 RepID=UPI001E8C9F94|nr:uncharacterized protein BGZ61DRAFT_372375 [Ilyonectria robusta]KAH8656404.1 hypothetical protein BGZ61DRAFT_372375 [Ilyonectria robusta]
MSSTTSMPTSSQWYDRHRRCKDGCSHEGKLELITWTSTAGGDRMGWGNCLASESDELKEKFEKEFNSNEEKMYEYWPQGFRWTCCGTEGDQRFGCDHHGNGSTPCSCDFCKMGKPIPDSIYKNWIESAAGKGLRLSRGPDPRSFNRSQGGIAEIMRSSLGIP